MPSGKAALRRLFETADNGERGYVRYADYCNTDIRAAAPEPSRIDLVRYDRRPPGSLTVRTTHLDTVTFLDGVALWLVVGETRLLDSPSDPLDW